MKSVVLIPTKYALSEYPEHFTKGRRYEGMFYSYIGDGSKARYMYLTNQGTELHITEGGTSPYVTFAPNKNVIGGKLV